MATTDDQGRFLGNDEILWVSASEPTGGSETDTAQYTKVGLLVSNPFSGDAEEITATDKVTSRFSSSLAGSAGYTIEVEANRPAVVDSGQEIIRDAWLNGTNVYWLITTDTSTEEAKYGQASVTSYGEPSPTDDHATATSTLSGQGAPTFTTLA